MEVLAIAIGLAGIVLVARRLSRCGHDDVLRERKQFGTRMVPGWRCQSCGAWAPMNPERLTLEERRRPTWPAG